MEGEGRFFPSGQQQLASSGSDLLPAENPAENREAPTIHEEPAAHHQGMRESNYYMIPMSHVTRIMRQILPSHARISDDAKLTIQECASEFIHFITSEANDRCRRLQRRTLTADDVLSVMDELGFDDYFEPLAAFVDRLRDADPPLWPMSLQRVRAPPPYHRSSFRWDPRQMGMDSHSWDVGSGSGSSGNALPQFQDPSSDQ